MEHPRALIVVDVQNDFLPGGALGVREGDRVVEPINARMAEYDLVYATQDWHPRDHLSFAANHPGRNVGDVIDLEGLRQILWPVHCVQNTPGAAFAPGLATDRFIRVFRKGIDRTIDSYSGFFDNGHRRATGLADELKQRGVQQVHVVGIATDYCVKFTALDAVTLGFDVTLIASACRGVNLQPGDVARAMEEMRAAGINIVE